MPFNGISKILSVTPPKLNPVEALAFEKEELISPIKTVLIWLN